MKPMIPVLYAMDFMAANGVPFRVLAIAVGAEGPNKYRAPATDRTDPIVEFYDRIGAVGGKHGQFTGGYYDADTLLGRDGYGHADGGLNLYGGVDDWTVDADSMDLVRAWLTRLVDGGYLGGEVDE